MKTYTITDIEDAYEEWANAEWRDGALTAEEFVAWLRKQDDIDDLLSFEDEFERDDEGQPVVVNGVPGYASLSEIGQLELTTDDDGSECCNGLTKGCCR